jgi:uncharacterized membrane protein YgcG
VARKNVADAAKAKADKQKKIAIGLGVVLALAMAYAVHTMMSLNGGNKDALPQAATVTTVATGTPSTPVTPSTALPAAPTLSGAAPTTAATPLSTQLVSAVKPPAGAGQLESFSLFDSKDPFNSLGPAGSSAGGGTSSSSGSSGSGGSGAKTPPPPPTPPPTSAVISVNGVSESVASGGAFPTANPMFQLVSLTASAAKVAVVGGSYASGAPTLTLEVNKPVTLQNTADGTRYTLILMPQGTQATGGAASGGGASSSPTTTTPTTTTGG